jgi:hypothetical protein
VRLAGLQRALERLAVRIGEHEHLPGGALLRDDGDETGGVEAQLVEPDHR